MACQLPGGCVMPNDPLAQFKAVQREAWSLFLPLEAVTTMPAARLIARPRIRGGQTLLSNGCGPNVVALPATRPRARTSWLDPSPVLLHHAPHPRTLTSAD